MLKCGKRARPEVQKKILMISLNTHKKEQSIPLPGAHGKVERPVNSRKDGQTLNSASPETNRLVADLNAGNVKPSDRTETAVRTQTESRQKIDQIRLPLPR